MWHSFVCDFWKIIIIVIICCMRITPMVNCMQAKAPTLALQTKLNAGRQILIFETGTWDHQRHSSNNSLFIYLFFASCMRWISCDPPPGNQSSWPNMYETILWYIVDCRIMWILQRRRLYSSTARCGAPVANAAASLTSSRFLTSRALYARDPSSNQWVSSQW